MRLYAKTAAALLASLLTLTCAQAQVQASAVVPAGLAKYVQPALQADPNVPLQSTVRFAYLSDTHISVGSERVNDLKACVRDINGQQGLDFVIFAGDMTEFGADREIRLVKEIIDSLTIPYYVAAGNHDAKWSESGCNTFAKTFGYEQFDFTAGGIRFIGCNSGPNMRMAPALVPRETIVWLDSLTKVIPKEQPVIFVNHYPQDSTVLNYVEVLDILKRSNVQLIMSGHYHQNMKMEYSGIPAFIGRAPDANKTRETGYNIVSIECGKVSVCEKYVGKPLRDTWYTSEITATPRRYEPTRDESGWMDFDVNDRQTHVQAVWRYQDDSDIGAQAVLGGKTVVFANTAGVIRALNAADGKLLWSYATGNKIFSTPAVEKGRVVVGCSDGCIYCLALKDGKLLWRYRCEKSVLGSPAIMKGIAYIGTSDGEFRALRVKDGSILWRFDGVKGFVECKPYVDNKQVVFGDWANTLYSLDPKTGRLQWKWETPGSRMLSPAAVYPVKANGRIYFVTPRRKTYCLDAATGFELWCQDGGRESIGISADGSTVYVKSMSDEMLAWSTTSQDANLVWRVRTGLGYDISPTPSAYCTVQKDDPWVILCSDKGNIHALRAADGSKVFDYKISRALVNGVVPLKGGLLLASTMDGIVTLLKCN